MTAAEEGQQARAAGRFRDARRAFIACADAACPNPLRTDCAKWLDAVDSETPSIVCVAKDAKGNDLVDVTVRIDGQESKDCARGVPVTLDPGQHVVLFERGNGVQMEERIVARAGERQHQVVGMFAPPTVAAVMTEPARESRPLVPTTSWILGGVGVLGLGSFITFGLVGSSEREELKRTCAPACSDDDVSGLRSAYVVADISLVVGVVALGVATFIAISHADQRPTGAAQK